MAEYGGKRQIAVDCGSLVVGLWLLSRWKQVDVYKVLPGVTGCPVTVSKRNETLIIKSVGLDLALIIGVDSNLTTL